MDEPLIRPEIVDHYGRYEEADSRAAVLEVIRRVENEPSPLGMSPHLLGLGVAP